MSFEKNYKNYILLKDLLKPLEIVAHVIRDDDRSYELEVEKNVTCSIKLILTIDKLIFNVSKELLNISSSLQIFFRLCSDFSKKSQNNSTVVITNFNSDSYKLIENFVSCMLKN